MGKDPVFAFAVTSAVAFAVAFAVALAVALAFLVVIPEGDLRLLLSFAFHPKTKSLFPQICPQKHMSSPKLTKTRANQGN